MHANERPDLDDEEMQDMTPALPPILCLPPEVMSSLLLYMHPIDVSRFSRTCVEMYDFTHPNPHLWRSLFHLLFDPLPAALLDGRKPYEMLVQDRIQATGVAFREPQAVDDVMRNAIKSILSIASQSLSPTSKNTRYLQAYLPPIVDFCLEEETAEESSWSDQRLLAHYLCLHGAHVPEDRLRSLRTVYSIRNYSSRTKFGPYLPDHSGRIDWASIRAIRHVMERNIEDAITRGQWADDLDLQVPVGGTWSAVAKRSDGLDDRDWAGVGRKHVGSYAFLSMDVFEALNSDACPDLSQFSEAVGEAVRPPPILLDPLSNPSLQMTLRLTLDPATSHPATRSHSHHLSDSRYPPLSFTGLLESLSPSPTSLSLSVTGTVSYSNGETTWKYLIHYAGVVQWALEGAQVGEPGSRMGCMGIWTHAGRVGETREVGGPCGPFWWWPVEN